MFSWLAVGRMALGFFPERAFRLQSAKKLLSSVSTYVYEVDLLKDAVSCKCFCRVETPIELMSVFALCGAKQGGCQKPGVRKL